MHDVFAVGKIYIQSHTNSSGARASNPCKKGTISYIEGFLISRGFLYRGVSYIGGFDSTVGINHLLTINRVPGSLMLGTSINKSAISHGLEAES